jgi:hypothetical protein
LAEFDRCGEARDVHLAASDQQAQDEEALLIGEEPQKARSVRSFVLKPQQVGRRHGIHRSTSQSIRST